MSCKTRHSKSAWSRRSIGSHGRRATVLGSILEEPKKKGWAGAGGGKVGPAASWCGGGANIARLGNDIEVEGCGAAAQGRTRHEMWKALRQK